MPTIRFLGKIVPSTGYTMSLHNLPTVNYKSQETGIEAEIAIRVHGSAVDVECKMPRFATSDVVHLHKVAYDTTRAAVNVLSFSTGIALTVIFDEYVDEHGNTSAFVIHHPDLAELCTICTVEVNKPFNDIEGALSIILVEPILFLALDDLITATTLHHLITVNCARSVEGLRHAMASPGMTRNQEWEVFRANLNLDKKYIQLITEHSASGRHGEGAFVPGTITKEIIRRSWTIMNRFLEFRKRGNLALPGGEFPILAG